MMAGFSPPEALKGEHLHRHAATKEPLFHDGQELGANTSFAATTVLQ